MNSEETGQNNISHCIETFLAETSKGPIYTCSCCRQTNFVQNVQKVSALQLGTHRDMLTRCLTGFKSQENCEWLCTTYKADIYKDLVPKLSLENKMGFPPKPTARLYPLEEVLISTVLAFMTIQALPVCGFRTQGQKVIIGNVVHVPNDVSSTVQMLPHVLDDMGTIPLKLKR